MYGSISAKNDEQRLGMKALLNPDVEVVTISGPAGTGKTLMAICAALQQEKSFEKIVITRQIIGLNGSDYGFLPGDGKKKVNPYMKPIYDNLDFIKSHCNDGEQGNTSGKSKKGGKISKIDDLINDESRFVIEPLAYIRGRTYHFTYFIVEEAQNLSRSDLLAIITRIGEHSKIILIGDPDQTDLHYMDRNNNGLTYAIEKFKNYPKAAHITLVKGERSVLSEWASMNL
jgi:PhoH-like ATPase